MNAVIQKLERTDEVIQETGTIADVEDDVFVVDASSGRYRARCAVSCLVEPERGDEVLFAGRTSGDLYVLSVLARPGSDTVRLRVPGDLVMKLDRGKLVVASAEGIDLLTGRDISMMSKGLEIRTNQANLVFDHLAYLGKKALAELEQVRTVVGLFDSVLERFSQRVKRSYRVVEQYDQLRAEQIDYAATSNLRLRGKNAMITAKALVKVDGSQIHLG